jgi:ABC-type sugar transport system permease subunit
MHSTARTASRPAPRAARNTVPTLRPLFHAPAAHQVFDTVAVLTQGGPAKSTEVLLYTMYTEGFTYFRSGYGAAISVVFLAFVLALTLIQARILDRRVHYA